MSPDVEYYCRLSPSFPVNLSLRPIEGISMSKVKIRGCSTMTVLS